MADKFEHEQASIRIFQRIPDATIEAIYTDVGGINFLGNMAIDSVTRDGFGTLLFSGIKQHGDMTVTVEAQIVRPKTIRRVLDRLLGRSSMADVIFYEVE